MLLIICYSFSSRPRLANDAKSHMSTLSVITQARCPNEEREDVFYIFTRLALCLLGGVRVASTWLLGNDSHTISAEVGGAGRPKRGQTFIERKLTAYKGMLR